MLAVSQLHHGVNKLYEFFFAQQKNTASRVDIHIV